MERDEDKPQPHVKVDRQFASDALKIIAVLVAAITWYTKTEARMNRIDEIILEIKDDARRQRVDLKEVQAEWRADLKELKVDVQRVANRMERRPSAAASPP